MKNSKYIILYFGFLLLLASCDNWLDVSPKTEVKETDLFSKESGFKTALLGQYINMSKPTLYGGNLTMGFMDILAQYYSVTSEKSEYMPMSLYDYENEKVKPVVTQIWGSMYEIIANLNNLLYNMEAHQDLFTGSNYSIIKGEALGLRAFLHFDLLRMYAPSYTAGKNSPAIPYVDKVTHIPFPQLTVTQVAEAAIQDLLEAEALLREVDPIGPAFKNYSDNWSENAEYGSDEGFLSFRRERMNYWAVVATLARVYLYIDNYPKAYEYAYITMKTARVNPAEVVFKLYSDKLTTYSDRYFNPKLDAENQLVVPIERKNEIYETDLYGSVDNRLKEWFNYYPNTNDEFMSKYMKQKESEPVNIPLIRGCEVYYIGAESTTATDSAFIYLNQVRNSFDISRSFDLKEGIADFELELYHEYRKSFVGEGQLFYFMKRKNFTMIENSAATNFPDLYTFPVPDTEIEFGNIAN